MSDPQSQVPRPKKVAHSKPSETPLSKTPSSSGNGDGFSHRPHYPNPPETVNPDAATLKEQWRFAIRQYSKWYSHAWGTAILAGVSFFALGWVIKGSNPLPSFSRDDSDKDKDRGSRGAAA